MVSVVGFSVRFFCNSAGDSFYSSRVAARVWPRVIFNKSLDWNYWFFCCYCGSLLVPTVLGLLLIAYWLFDRNDTQSDSTTTMILWWDFSTKNQLDIKPNERKMKWKINQHEFQNSEFVVLDRSNTHTHKSCIKNLFQARDTAASCELNGLSIELSIFRFSFSFLLLSSVAHSVGARWINETAWSWRRSFHSSDMIEVANKKWISSNWKMLEIMLP